MDNRFIKVSIITITYNHEKYIKKCLDSIIKQDVNFSYEVLIGNDCSPDNTVYILDEYEHKYNDIFKVYNRKKNLGATKNLLDLLRRAQGEYIIGLEGDDYWTDRNKLSELVNILDKNKEFYGVFHDISEVDETGYEISEYPCKQISDKIGESINCIEDFIEYTKETNLGQVFHIQSLMFRNFFKENDDENINKLLTTGKMIADLPLKLIIISKGPILYYRKNMGKYRRVRKIGGTSFSSQSSEFVYEETMNLWNKIDGYFNKKYNDLILDIIQMINTGTIIYNIRVGNYKFVKKIFVKLSASERKRFFIELINKTIKKSRKIFKILFLSFIVLI